MCDQPFHGMFLYIWEKLLNFLFFFFFFLHPCLLLVCLRATSTWQSVPTCGLTALSPSTMEGCPPSSTSPFSMGWVWRAGLLARCEQNQSLSCNVFFFWFVLCLFSFMSLILGRKSLTSDAWCRNHLKLKKVDFECVSVSCVPVFSPFGSRTSPRTATTLTWRCPTPPCCGPGPATWPCSSPWPRKLHPGRASLKVTSWSQWHHLLRMMWVSCSFHILKCPLMFEYAKYMQFDSVLNELRASF